MANVINRHAVRPRQAQSARESRDHQSQQATQATAADPSALADQHHPDARIRRAKEHARYRNHEATVVQRAESGERAGPGTGDRQGEVA
jgi:hypothetical protein